MGPVDTVSGNSDMTETVSTAWWESKLARRLDYLAVLAAMVIVCRLALEEDLSWTVLVMLGIPVVLLTLTRWPYGALSVLIGMSAMPRFFNEQGRANRGLESASHERS